MPSTKPPSKAAPPKRAPGFDYELLSRIGQGGVGQVWLATNLHDKQFYAVKFIHSSYEVELDGVREYKRRAKDHPKLVPIEHVGEISEFYYYVMPLADDATGLSPLLDPNQYEPLTLQLYLDRRAPLPLDEVLAITRDLLDGLDHVHSMGAAHCDVKPANVMRMAGSWRLGDHGLMRRSENVTPSCGTMKFWPPEGPRDRAADLYALGKMMFLALTGVGLQRFGEFEAGTLDIPGDDPRADGLRKIILQICAEQPSGRLPGANAIRNALLKLKTKRTTASPTHRRTVLAAVAVMILALTGYWIWDKTTFFKDAASLDGASSVAPAVPAASETSERIEITSKIIQHRGSGLVGEIGHTSNQATIEDDIRVQMQLSRPAYCYLIALNPDGRDQLCSPEGIEETPIRRVSLDFPAEQESSFGLTDGTGFQAFVLLASNQPLPPYRIWRSRIGELPWRRFESQGSWRYDNGQIQQLSSTRGTVRQRPDTPQPFVETCEVLKNLSTVDTVYAVAFPVVDTDRRP